MSCIAKNQTFTHNVADDYVLKNNAVMPYKSGALLSGERTNLETIRRKTEEQFDIEKGRARDADSS